MVCDGGVGVVHGCGDLSGFTSDKLSSQSKIRHILLSFVYLQGESTAAHLLPEQIDFIRVTTICIYAINVNLYVVFWAFYSLCRLANKTHFKNCAVHS